MRVGIIIRGQESPGTEACPYAEVDAQAGFKSGTRPTKGLSLRDAERCKTVPYGRVGTGAYPYD